MSLTEDVIFADPALQRVFFDRQALAPLAGHDAIVNMATMEIANLKIEFFKARAVETAEAIGWQIRRHYFLARRHSEGRRMDALEKIAADGCEHVELFAHDERDPEFNIDTRARAAYRHRYSYRPTTPARHRRRRTRPV